VPSTGSADWLGPPSPRYVLLHRALIFPFPRSLVQETASAMFGRSSAFLFYNWLLGSESLFRGFFCFLSAVLNVSSLLKRLVHYPIFGLVFPRHARASSLMALTIKKSHQFFRRAPLLEPPRVVHSVLMFFVWLRHSNSGCSAQSLRTLFFPPCTARNVLLSYAEASQIFSPPKECAFFPF